MMERDFKIVVQIMLIQTVIVSLKTILCNRCGMVKEPQVIDSQKIIIPFLPGPEAEFTREDYNQITGKKHCGFRWVKRNESYHGIVPGPSSGYNKYDFKNLSLVISDVMLSDVMTYFVECQFDRTVNNLCSAVRTNEVELTKAIIYQLRVQNTTVLSKTTFSTESTTVKESLEPSSGKGSPLGTSNVSTIILAVCAVVIVAIVSATVLLIFRNKRAQQEGNRHLVSPEVFVSAIHGTCSSDGLDSDLTVSDPTNRYVDSNTLQRSPMLPRRPEDSLNEYSSEYATIDEAKMLNGTIKPGACRDEDTSKGGGKLQEPAQFNVKFPYINCSSITRNLSQQCSYADQDTSRGHDRVIKRQSRHSRRRSRDKSSELKYITLDHMGAPGCWHGNDGQPDRSQLTKEYAAIDFDRKAFVAPIRKAPSSWYKRKRRNR